jgi:hypothetical protein
MTQTLLSEFTNIMLIFIDFVIEKIPDDADLLKAQQHILRIKKINPRLIIRAWNTQIMFKYGKQIIENDFNYFLNIDLQNDIEENVNSCDINSTTDTLDRLRKRISELSECDKSSAMNFVSTLANISNKYYSV